MTNGYRDNLLLDVEDQDQQESADYKLDEDDEIYEIIEETKREIQAIFENAA